MNEMSDKLELIDKLNVQKNRLMKDNDKLKGNIRTLRKANLGQSYFGFNKKQQQTQ